MQLAITALRSAVAVKTSADTPRNLRILLKGQDSFENDLKAERQAFRISQDDSGLRIESPGVGLAYGAFRLAESIRSRGFDFRLQLEQTPAFAERMFSYQGVLLDFPDEGYYFRDTPHVNRLVLNQQVEAAKEAMRRLAVYSFNQVAFLSLNFEDFVNYDLLGDGFTVYPPDSMHRKRTPVFRAALKELTEYAHSLHQEFWLQIYELSFPDHIDGRRLSDDSEYTWAFVNAKFDELLRNTPVDGIVVTPTEPSPRLNYRGFQLWRTSEGAGRMADRYYDAIVKRNGRKMIFRTWRAANDMATFDRLLSGTSNTYITFDAKYTDGDFFLCVGPNKLLSGGAPKQRPFAATLDTFTQYDGWGRMLFFPASWGEHFTAFQKAGVQGVNAWGPWLPGCIYPGIWVGKWDDWDVVRHGPAPSLAPVRLFSRLAWNPRLDSRSIASEWASEYFGKCAADIAEALFLSEELWKTTYLDDDPHSGLAFKWTMLFLARPDMVRKYGAAWTHDGIRELNRKGVDLARRIRSLVMKADAHATDPEALAGIQWAADLTLLYFETFTRWRELVYLMSRATPVAATDREAALGVITEIEAILPSWRRYPREARNWLVLEFDPDLVTAPGWLERTCVVETLKKYRRELSAMQGETP